MVVSRRGMNLKLQEVQPRREGSEGPECIRMEGFGCDPAKIVAKDKTSQVNQVGRFAVSQCQCLRTQRADRQREPG